MDNLLNRDWPQAEPWIVAVVVLGVWCLFGWAFQKALAARLRRWAEKTEGTFDDALVAALPGPLNLLVFVTGMMVALRFTPEQDAQIARIHAGFEILLLLGLVYLADRLGQAALKGLEQRREALRHSHVFLSALLHVAVWSIGGLMVLGNLGVSITPILASLGVGSLAVALALQSTLANLFSGFYLLLDRPVRVGDFIKLESGEEGTVEAVGWRTTQIKTLGNLLIVLPNSKLAEAKIVNYDRPDKELSFVVEVGTAYDSDLEKVERVTLETARDTMAHVPGAAKHFEPAVRFHGFGPSSIDFSVSFRAKSFKDQFLIKHEFIKALQKRYKKEGIEIPYPTQTLSIRPQTIKRGKRRP
jgi:small-conductance mechanosensitive channel